MKSKRPSKLKLGANERAKARSQQRVVRERIVRECAEQVPTTWLDNLLTGPNAVLKGNGGTWGCPEIEAVCKGIKARILALSNAAMSDCAGGKLNS